MIVPAQSSEGPDLFAHDVLHRLETALGSIEARAPRES